MRRDQLEHAIRAACQIIGSDEVIVVGSQAWIQVCRMGNHQRRGAWIVA
jgi:hypothetical protein